MNPDLPKASCLSLEDYEARHIVHRLVNKIFTNVIKTYSESEEDKKVKEEEIAKKVKEEEIAKKARQLRSEKTRIERGDEEIVRALVAKIFKRVVKTQQREEMIAVEEKKKHMREDQTYSIPFERFLREKVILGSKVGMNEVNSTDLLEAYNTFLSAVGISQRADAKRLSKLMLGVGFERQNNLDPRKNGRGYVGIKLRLVEETVSLREG